jgi:thymidylate synthase
MVTMYGSADYALIDLAGRIMRHGEEVGSRMGDRTMERCHESWALANPLKREITVPGRGASLPAQIAETMWVLDGRNDVEWLSAYLPRAADFSDDGKTWRGGYGPRLRTAEGYAEPVDQLAHVVNVLREDPTSRRAVISLYDPSVDTEPGKDIPCNNWLHFTSRLGKLDLHVVARSNDLIWGWSGINQFEWSTLQEIVAHLLGLRVGDLHFTVGSLHIYDRHWGKARELSSAQPATADDSPRFQLDAPNRTVEHLDVLIKAWFELEYHIRRGTYSDDELLSRIDRFTEPMFRSWLSVIAYYWTGSERFKIAIQGTRLAVARSMSPNGGKRALPRKTVTGLSNAKPAEDVQATGHAMSRNMERSTMDPFLHYVSKLHEEKGKVYGDSWKKRGEQMSIMANIARKVDRAGIGGAGDSEADTYIDLLVYLLKYSLWLTDGGAGRFLSSIYDDANEYSRFDGALIKASKMVGPDKNVTREEVNELFDALTAAVDEQKSVALRWDLAWTMATLILPVARIHWTEEQRRSNGHAERNATRSWNPEAGLEALSHTLGEARD